MTVAPGDMLFIGFIGAALISLLAVVRGNRTEISRTRKKDMESAVLELADQGEIVHRWEEEIVPSGYGGAFARKFLLKTADDGWMLARAVAVLHCVVVAADAAEISESMARSLAVSPDVDASEILGPPRTPERLRKN